VRAHDLRGRASGGERARQLRAEPAGIAAYLVVYQHVPIARAGRQLIADVTGARAFIGWISSVLSALAGLLTEVTQLIRSLIVLVHVIRRDHQQHQMVSAGGHTSRAPRSLPTCCTPPAAERR
jgi:hypothetical protein